MTTQLTPNLARLVREEERVRLAWRQRQEKLELPRGEELITEDNYWKAHGLASPPSQIERVAALMNADIKSQDTGRPSLKGSCVL